mgnify:CR=1 FL=1
MPNYNYIDKDFEIGTNYYGNIVHQGCVWNESLRNEIYSAQELVQILNEGIADVFRRFIYKAISMYDDTIRKYDPWWEKDFVPNIQDRPIAFFCYEDDRLRLYILAYMRRVLSCDPDVTARKMQLGFSYNLFKYLKGFPLKDFDKEGYFCLDVPDAQWNTCSRESLPMYKGSKLDEPVECEYYVFEGEKVNLTTWSDYIGMAVTTSDFPVKGQIYPHFNYEPGAAINRRGYVSKSEEAIRSAKRHADDKQVSLDEVLKDEDIQEQNKSSIKDSILFVKYFDPSDNLDHINYENNNVQMALKLDLERVMPLQRFTMSLWLIDRYDNFEPLVLRRKEFDAVVKMQSLLQQIKGTEKENRVVVDRVELAPRPEQRFISPELLKPPQEEQLPQQEQEIDENALKEIIEPVLKKMKQEQEEEEQVKQLLALVKKEEDEEEESKNDLY